MCCGALSSYDDLYYKILVIIRVLPKSRFADFVKSAKSVGRKKPQLTENKILAPQREPAVLRVLRGKRGRGFCPLEGLLAR